MSERKYSLKEIDQMRGDVWTLTINFGLSFREGEANAMVEDRLRTHMQNGTDPEELHEAANDLRQRRADAALKAQR